MDKKLLIIGLLGLMMMMVVSAVSQEIDGDYSFWLDNETCRGWVKVEGDKVFENSWTHDNNESHKFEDDFTTEISVNACTTQDIVCPTLNCPSVNCPEAACNCPEIDYSKFPAPSCDSSCPDIQIPECDVGAVIEDGKKLDYKDAGLGFIVGVIVGGVALMYYLRGRYGGSGVIPQTYTGGMQRQVNLPPQQPGKELPRFR